MEDIFIVLLGFTFILSFELSNRFHNKELSFDKKLEKEKAKIDLEIELELYRKKQRVQKGL